MYLTSIGRLATILAMCTLCSTEAYAGRLVPPTQQQRHVNATLATAAPMHPTVDLGANIANATRYLLDSIETSGQFRYRVNMNPRVSVGKRYNVLRHAGTIYALSMSYDHNPSPATKEAILRASKFLVDCCVGTLPEREDLLGIWSIPQLTYSRHPAQVKLGGVGLGLVALTSAERLRPGSIQPEVFTRLGEFVVFMQKQDGSFYSKYVPTFGGRQDMWTSLYYPGEAALGLVMLYELDGSARWLTTAAKALAYLAKSRKGASTVPADHWALLATAKLLSTTDFPSEIVSRETLIAHAVQICESMLSEQLLHSWEPRYIGGFTPDGRTTPTATRLEGLLAALTFLPRDQIELRGRITHSTSSAIRFLRRAQIESGPFTGGIPRAVRHLPDYGFSDVAKFNQRVGEIRIDYVQHALSAMIQYEQLSLSVHR